MEPALGDGSGDLAPKVLLCTRTCFARRLHRKPATIEEDQRIEYRAAGFCHSATSSEWRRFCRTSTVTAITIDSVPNYRTRLMLSMSSISKFGIGAEYATDSANASMKGWHLPTPKRSHLLASGKGALDTIGCTSI
jgi:hypothetical protein